MDKTIHGHNISRTCQFVDKMFRGHASSWTVDDLRKDVLWTSWTIRG